MELSQRSMDIVRMSTWYMVCIYDAPICLFTPVRNVNIHLGKWPLSTTKDWKPCLSICIVNNILDLLGDGQI